VAGVRQLLDDAGSALDVTDVYQRTGGNPRRPGQHRRRGEGTRADLETQEAYGVHYLRYWVDQEHGKIFCLVDAPDADAAATVHREARARRRRDLPGRRGGITRS
jgi:hypothetical protein